jgi:hypothetical protein
LLLQTRIQRRLRRAAGVHDAVLNKAFPALKAADGIEKRAVRIRRQPVVGRFEIAEAP